MQVRLDDILHPMQYVVMNALDAYLKEKGLGASDFAALVCTSESSISRLRRGLQNPSFELLARIASATNGAVTPNDFLNDAEVPPSSVLKGATV